MKRLLDDASKLIKTKSESREGNEEVVNHLSHLLKDRSFHTFTQQVLHSRDDISKKQYNIVGILGDKLVDRKTRKGLLLLSHLDTSLPGHSDYWVETNRSPLNMTIQGNRLIGLGVAQGKLDFLCKLKAAEKFRERKLQMPIYIAGTCGGELGHFGSRYLIKALTLNPKFVLVGAPTDLRVIFSHKSQTQFELAARFSAHEKDARGFNRRIDLYSFGLASHSATPELGRSAFEILIELLQSLEREGFDFRVRNLETSRTENQLPDMSQAEIYFTTYQFEDFKKFFKDYVTRLGLERHFRAEIGGLGDVGIRFLPPQAIQCLFDLATWIKTLQSEWQSLKDESFSPQYSILSIEEFSIRPQELVFRCSIYALPQTDSKILIEQTKMGLANISRRYPTINLLLRQLGHCPALTMTEEHSLVEICGFAMQDAGLTPMLDKLPYPTEAADFFNEGFESVAFGPGPISGSSHGPNESIMLEQLERAVLFYEKLIEKVCL